MTRALSIVVLLVLACPPAPAGEVVDLRVWDGPDHTRTVLDIDKPVEYRIFTLDDPPRVVVDIEDAGLDHALELGEDAKGMLSGVRTGIREGDDLRVVFDVNRSVRPKSFLLPPAEQYGHRLVVDLYPEDGASDSVRTVKTVDEGRPRDVVIAVDPGHGGEDPGATGAGGTREKHVVLAVARELAGQINDVRGMRAVLIRDGDYYVPLVERFQKARKHKADLFISIHADAFYQNSVRGSSVFVLSQRGATSQAAKWLAERENASDLVGGVRLSDKDDLLAKVLLDLSQSASMEASREAADSVLSALAAVGPTHKNRVERANFVVLRSPDVPSMLVETAFISNPEEERRLNDPAHRRRLARAVLTGLVSHFADKAPPGTLIAKEGIDTHVVSRGDTLSEIATRYDVSLSALRAANGIDGNVLQVGAVLKIPPS